MGRAKARRHPRTTRIPVPRHEQQFCAAGKWLFDVEHAYRIIRGRPRLPIRVDVEVWARIYGLDGNPNSRIVPGPSLDPVHSATVDLTRPVILATIPTSTGGHCEVLIDGTHRLLRAFTEGVESLPASVLDIHETEAIVRARP